MIEIGFVSIQSLNLRITLDTARPGTDASGNTTSWSVLQLEIVSTPKHKKAKRSSVMEKVSEGFVDWSQGNLQGLDSLGVHLEGTEFQRSVLATMRHVPYGATCSYSELANLSGFPNARRAVASVCARNKVPLIIPCHRIIKSDGSIGKYFYGSATKEKLLKMEASIH